jgi:hypothetical protein
MWATGNFASFFVVLALISRQGEVASDAFTKLKQLDDAEGVNIGELLRMFKKHPIYAR